MNRKEFLKSLGLLSAASIVSFDAFALPEPTPTVIGFDESLCDFMDAFNVAQKFDEKTIEKYQAFENVALQSDPMKCFASLYMMKHDPKLVMYLAKRRNIFIRVRQHLETLVLKTREQEQEICATAKNMAIEMHYAFPRYRISFPKGIK